MVKSRPSRSAQSTHVSHARLLSPESLDYARHIAQVPHEEKCDLSSEKSFLLSSELPIAEIDTVQLNPNRNLRSYVSKCKTQSIHNGPVLRLPRTNFTNSPNFSQHYVLISNKSLDLPVVLKSNGNKSSPADLVDVSAKELAEREATVNKTIRKLKAKGLWMNDRLPKVMEPEWLKCHWDYFLDEALWLAEDFRQERLWKKAMAKRLACEAALAVMIRAELARREALKLELLREYGAAKVAQFVREWWSGVSKASDMSTLLSEHRLWQSALRQNRFALTQLTDTGAKWFSSAISRSSCPPVTNNPIPFLDEDEADLDYTLPRSSVSSITSESPEIIPPEESATFNLDDFEWGLQSETPLVDSFSSQQSDDGKDANSISGRFSNEATSEEDLDGLRADASVPLHEVLESALDNGWRPQQLFSNSRPCSSEMDSSSADLDSLYHSALNTLRHEATLPLRQLLPPGYQPISTTNVGINGSDGVSLRRRQPLRRFNRPTGSTLLNGCSINEDSSTNDSSIDDLDYDSLDRDGEVISSEVSVEYGVESMEIDGYHSDSEQSAASSSIWNTATDPSSSFPPLPPAELARRARGLSSFRVKTTSRRLLQCRLPSFGPTCRVPFLPTPSLYSGVSWLSNTYAQRVPTCLVSYSIPCADAALCLAVHIGQLAASDGGDWGPHLVVTPRLLLPTWRIRLTTVCPGLRMQCVLASSPGGTGRRLKAAAAQRAFHVCLTTYSALRSRPSRFEGIQWHLVILDQVQHLTNSAMSSRNEGGAAENDQSRVSAGTSFALSTPTHHQHHRRPTTAPSFVLPDLAHTLIHRVLTWAHQRVCIFSVTDASIGDLCEANGTPLKILFGLLLLHLPTAKGDNDGNLIEDAVRQASLIKPEPNVSTSGEEVMAALEPFLYRFFDEEEDDDDDFVDGGTCVGGSEGTDPISVRSNSNTAIEKLVRFKFLSDHLTAEQRCLHDKLLLGKVCTRASRSGHLPDLLTSLSMGVRLCLHPWLLAGQDETLDWLSQDRKPGPLPPCPAMSGLRFDSPACLLAELEKEKADTPIPPLPSTLQAPTHIRNRVVELLPSSEQLKAALASPKSTPVQIGKRRSEHSTTEGDSQLPMKISRMEGLDVAEGQKPFISEETYRFIQLEVAKAAFETNKGTPLAELESISSAFSESEAIDRNAAPNTANLSVEAKSRLHILESRCQRTRLELEDQADWCSSSTMEYIRHISREPSLFPTGINVFPVLPFIDSSASSTSYAICRVVLDRFSRLPSFSSPYSLYCTRDRAVSLPAQLIDAANGAAFLPDFDETLSKVVNLLYPLLPRSRWISSQTVPHRLAQFLAASGKIQRLRELLLEFVRTPPGTKSRRPRVVFLMSHHAAFLDLLTTWLSVDPPFSCLPRFRAPIDHLDFTVDNEDANSYFSDTGPGWIERVNDWPRGTRGPLIVLMHGRAPFLSVSGLRAGPDTRVIVCDVEWRKEVNALIKSKLRCWSLNGLVDVPPRAQYNLLSMSHRLQVYRLVTEWDSGDSIEARLLKSSAIHLLPDAVFKTVAGALTLPDASAINSSTKSRASAASANALSSPLTSSTSRVQPNVVRKLFSKLRRRAQLRTSEAPKALAIPSMDSDESEDEVTTQDEESDNASSFHNREPVQKQMLTQCFDLYEAPRDVQAWCSNLAEDTAIAAEIHGDKGAVESTEELNISDIFDPILIGDFDALCHHSCAEINIVPPDVRERWVIDEASWQANFDALEEVLGYSDPLFYVPPQSGEASTSTNEGFADENDLPIIDAFKLPIWIPSFFQDADFCKEDLPAPYDKFNLSVIAADSLAKTTLYSETRWGYSSEPMLESELPPLAPNTTPPLFDSTNTTAAANFSRSANSNTTSRGANDASSGVASSYVLKRSAVTALSARNSASGGGSSAPPAKKRKLTGAAAIAAKRSASNKAAAAALASAASAGRTSHLENDEKSLSGVSSHDQPDLLTATSSSSIVSTASTTTYFTFTSSNQKVCLPRPFFARDARAVTGSGSALQSGTIYAASPGGAGALGSSYFTPSARIRRITTNVSGSSRLGGISSAGGVNMPGGGAAGVYAALNNPHLHAKYAVPTIGKPLVAGTASANTLPSAQRQAVHTSSGMVSFKFGSSGHVAASFNDARPPDWTPLEEAALLMYANRVLETPSVLSSSHHHHSTGSSGAASGSSSAYRVPNFRLAEICLNTFTSMCAYRSARQCLIAYCRISSAIVSSSAADLLPHPLGDDDKTGSTYNHHMYQHQHHHQAQHGVGRKVKSKMKSGMSTSLLASSTGLLHAGVSLSVPGGAGDSAGTGPNTSSVNKLRGYQHFLYLQSQLKSLGHKSPAASGAPSIPAMTSSTSSNNGTLDAQVSNIMRRCIRDGSLKHPTQQSGKHPLQFHPSVGMGTASATPPAHHLQGSGQVVNQRSGGAATKATMLMRNPAAAVASTVAGGTSLTPGSQQQLAMPATVIQKNPSHIAALQEHNISPDNLITPAIVIKNKEEREARQRTEAANAAAAAAASLATGAAPPNVTIMGSSTPTVGSGGVPGGTSAAVIVGSGNHASSVVSTARLHHHAHQHPTIVTISGSGGSSVSSTTGTTIPRSTNILPFSTAASVGYHGGSGASPTLFRYTTPSTGTAGGRQAGATATTTGILRRVGPNVIGGGGAQSVFSVTPACGTGTTHIISNTCGTTMMRRSVTLTATGVSQAGVGAAGGGLTVVATASGGRPGSVIYHHHAQGSTGPGTPTGITLLPTATTQGLPQIIRPRQQLRTGTSLSAQRFVRTFSATPASTSTGSGSTTPTTTLVHRTRDGLYTSPTQQHSQQRNGASGIIIPESQILLQCIPNTAHHRSGGTIQSPSVIGRHHQQHQQPPSSSRQ